MQPSSALRPASLADRLAAPLQRFLAIEAASAVLLLAATLLALAWANSPFRASYSSLWHTPLEIALGAGRLSLSLSLEHWVNDALMTIFFFLVGLEIKHELVHGELSSRERAMLPLFGALGGMLAPAAIYASLHAGGPAASGWGVPMATDIAFAIAALTAFGTRVPSGLKVFLLALAIVDDLGAVAVIALFYTADLSWLAIGWALAGLVLVYVMRKAGVRALLPYWIAGAFVWLATHESGIHATVAGVALGLLTPSSRLDPEHSLVERGRDLLAGVLRRIEAGGLPQGSEGRLVARQLGEFSRVSLSPVERLSQGIHPWSAFGIMPIFALANAGVSLDVDALRDPLALRVALGVGAGLLLGKPIGVVLLCWIAVRLRLAALPEGIGWAALGATGLLGGIGFTMALFLTLLAFDDPALVAASKVGVMGASLLAALIGAVLLSRALPPGAAAGGDRAR